MSLPNRSVLVGMVLGAVSGLALSTIGPGTILPAFADGTGSGVDASRLVKYEGQKYQVDHEDWVATDPLSTSHVKKIEAGRVSYVTITKTATGTYSTDAMFSDYVQYPGISVELVEPVRNAFRFWSHGSWQGFSTRDAGSFTYFSVSR